MRHQDALSDWISERLSMTTEQIYHIYKTIHMDADYPLSREAFAVKVSRVRKRTKKEMKDMDENFERFLFVSKVVELNKSAYDLLLGLECVKKKKEEVERRCKEIGVNFEIYDEDKIRWVSAEKDPLQK